MTRPAPSALGRRRDPSGPCPVSTHTTSAPGSSSPAAAGLGHAGHARRRRRLAEDALVPRRARGTPPRISSSVDRRRSGRRDSSRAAIAFVPRRRVADPDRGRDRVRAASIGWPSTSGAAPAAWKPEHPRRRRDDARPRAYSRKPGPVGADVAGVADRDGEDVGRPAEVVADLERAGLLALESERVDRVHEGDRMVVLLGERPDDAQRLRRSCRRSRRPGRRRRAPGGACPSRSCRPAGRRRPRARGPRRRPPPRPRCCRSRRR